MRVGICRIKRIRRKLGIRCRQKQKIQSYYQLEAYFPVAADIVGYAMGERLTRNLVSQSLFNAVAAKRPAKGLIHHSDRGSQYCSHEYRNILERFGLTAVDEP